MMTQRQMFIRSAFQFEPGKQTLDPGVQTAIVRHHDDDGPILIQQLRASRQCRYRVGRVLQHMQHRDDVVPASEINFLDQAMMNRKPNLWRQSFAYMS